METDNTKPVVAANHGGLTEIVVHGQTGLLFEPQNADELANALKLLLEDSAKCEKFGLAGYNRAVEHFSLQSHVNKFETIFEDIID